MDSVPKDLKLGVAAPLAEEIAEAKLHPNGWVYRIAGRFRREDAVPPEAIIGAWKVNAQGEIVGDFIENAKYDPRKWPVIVRQKR